jgi:hypothetical protein
MIIKNGRTYTQPDLARFQVGIIALLAVFITSGCNHWYEGGETDSDFGPRDMSDLDVIRQYGGISDPSQHEVEYRNGKLTSLNIDEWDGFLIKPNGVVDEERRWIWIVPSWLAVESRPPGEADAAVMRPDEKGKSIVIHRYYVEEFLSRGFHVAGIDVAITCGSEPGVEVYQKFHQTLVREHKMNPRARLLAQSSGGLTAYAWAWRHPRSVDRIMGIFPATDFRSWPGLDKVCGPGRITHSRLGFNMAPNELKGRMNEFNPIDNLKPLADAGVRILHIHGAQDAGIPVEENSIEFLQRYEGRGGEVELEILEGYGHGGDIFYTSDKAIRFLVE